MKVVKFSDVLSWTSWKVRKLEFSNKLLQICDREDYACWKF